MKMIRAIRKGYRAVRGNVFSVLLFALIFAVFIGGVTQASSANESESLRVARESIVRAIVSCYAIEGSYPETFEYIKENYGVGIDEGKYAVHYEVFASNIMPDVTILKK